LEISAGAISNHWKKSAPDAVRRRERIMSDVSRLKNLMLNDNGFAFDPSSGFTYNISLTGLEVIHWLKEGRSEAQIVDCLCAEFEVERKNVERDVDSFIGSLAKYGLIRLDNGAKK
jgi:PqqD family protein of HPr-rel-A system